MSYRAVEGARESSTVVLLRQAEAQLEVLLLQKNAQLNWGGSWVFPGGIIEEQDTQANDANDDPREAAALAAVIRETHEETGLELKPEQLCAFANWLTPKVRPKRYNTLFFIAALNQEQAKQTIQIDNQEIVDALWLTPAQALDAQASGEMILNGPSFVTLSQLKTHSNAEQAIAALCKQGIIWYEPRGIKTELGFTTVYRGDAAYDVTPLTESSIADHNQPKHRLHMHFDGAWQFEDTRESSL